MLMSVCNDAFSRRVRFKWNQIPFLHFTKLCIGWLRNNRLESGLTIVSYARVRLSIFHLFAFPKHNLTAIVSFCSPKRHTHAWQTTITQWKYQKHWSTIISYSLHISFYHTSQCNCLPFVYLNEWEWEIPFVDDFVSFIYCKHVYTHTQADEYI